MASATVTIFPTATGSTATPMVEVIAVPDLNIPLFIALGFIALFLATVCFGLRMYVRRVMLGQVGLDDYVLIAAYVSFVLLVFLFEAILIDLLQKGVTEEYFTTMGLGNIWILLCAFVTVLIRAAIATFFLRIIPSTRAYRPHRIIMMSAFSIYSMIMIIGPFLALFACGTHWREIDYEVSEVCLDSSAIEHTLKAGIVLTAASDWLMVLIPMVIVYKSALSHRTKVPAMMVIALGALGSVTSIVRIPLTYLAGVDGPQDLGHYMIYIVLALYDNCIAIMAICLAALRPLLQKYRRDGTTTHTNTGFQSSRRDERTTARDKNNIMYLTEFQVTKTPAAEVESIDKMPILG
ncbi:hypothetical protein K461DRAFT_265558 [Myriangium duriaei CBS 260.36]|uniref:Rhodopsin domain-containing protein n=1 Tax=Myriangium duriaei CBS 260.36 TaxID=1168546 RepID=A0A9P4JC39_9PEZI|nr:hypothetical protein K461DRAFT_265558 [Myriangium duriaei CBS 260.36]